MIKRFALMTLWVEDFARPVFLSGFPRAGLDLP